MKIGENNKEIKGWELVFNWVGDSVLNYGALSEGEYEKRSEKQAKIRGELTDIVELFNVSTWDIWLMTKEEWEKYRDKAE